MSNHERPIAWEKHPVSPERKAELRAKGFQIIDAAFMPEGYENPACRPAEVDEPSDGEPAKRRGRPPKE